MEHVGRKVKKEVRGRGSCFGAVEAYSPATGLFKVVYNDGGSEEMELAEVSRLLAPPSRLGGSAGEASSSIGGRGAVEGNLGVSSGIQRESGGNWAKFDLNASAEIDLNDGGEGGGSGGLHGLDLNEGMNYILYDDWDCNELPKTRTMIDLNIDVNDDDAAAADEIGSSKTMRMFDLNVELKEDQFEDHNQSAMEVDKGKAAAEDDDCRIVMAPPYNGSVGSGSGSGGGRMYNLISAANMELMRRILMASFPTRGYFAAGVYNHVSPFPPPPPPKADLPPSSSSLDLGGASLLDFLSVYAFLRSFSVSLLLSPFEIGDFAASLVSKDSSLLFDSIHLSLLTALRRHLISLSDEGCVSASVCLRSLNWDFLDSITWPVFLIEYLLFHTPKHIPGVDLSEFEPLQSDYYTMPAPAKVAILQHLCDDVVESEACKAEVARRGLMAEGENWRSRYFSCKKGKKKGGGDGGASGGTEEEYMNDFVDDGNGDECYLCKTDGSLICCDGCPAAFHAKCVGVTSSLLPDGAWFCPECTIDKGKPYKLTKCIRGLELLGTDPHARHYYSCCDHLLVADSCEGEYSLLLYSRDDIPAVVAALEASSSLYDKVASAIRRYWNLARAVDRMPNAANNPSRPGQFACPEPRLPSPRHHLTPSETNNQGDASAGRKSDEEAARDGGVMAEAILDDSQMQITANEVVESGEGRIGITANDGGASTSSNAGEIEPQVMTYANFYAFARMSSSFSKELASKYSAEDATKPAEQIIARQMRVISNKYAAFSWSNSRDLSLNTRKEKCGWCFCCKVPEDERDCLFVMSDNVRATENFTGEALGIQSGDGRKNHLIDVICHVIWIEDRLHGLLSGPWSNPRYSSRWRKSALEAAHVGYLKYLLLQLEANLHRRALSADWIKSADSAATMGSASHFVRKSTTRVPPKPQSRRSTRKCSKQDITPTPKDGEGVSLSWWRGGRASRELFNWKNLPRSLASKAARQGGCKKIDGVCYPDSGEYAKRTKSVAWAAAIEALKTVEQLALQVRHLDASIKWTAVGNINLLPEKEPKKPGKSFKDAVIRRRRQEGEGVKYLIDFGKNTLIPDLVVRHGSRAEDSTSKRRKYWLAEPHVPLHLLKAYGERRLARAAEKDVSGGREEATEAAAAERKKGFEYLFERAERLERATCEHCSESVLIREAVSCQYCRGIFHESHARESATSSSTAESPLYTCHRCWAMKRRSAHDLMLSLQTVGVKKRRGPRRAADPQKQEDLWSIVDNKMPKRRRADHVSSSYWLNGLRFSRRADDERSAQFRSRMLLLRPGEDASLDSTPKCSLCGELERALALTYVACESCGAWFHGDALNLSDERIQSIIGFECHNCLRKRPPVCPRHRRPPGTEDNDDA